MDIYILIILIILNIALLFLTFFKKQYIIGIFTGILFIFTGLFSWNGIKYVSATNINIINSSNIVISDNYSNWVHTFGSSSFSLVNLLGDIFILFGLFLLLVCAVMLWSGKKGDGGFGDEGEQEQE